MREPRRWERLVYPRGVKKVRIIRTNHEFTAKDDEGYYWTGRGWSDVHWSTLLGWGPLEEVVDSDTPNG